MDRTATLGLPYILGSQAQKHVTHNEALDALDVLVQLTVLDRHLPEPPSEPEEGDRYIVASPATGDWLGREGEIAARQGGVWSFLAPGEGWRSFVTDEATACIFSAGTWQAEAGGIVGASQVVAQQAHGAETRFVLLEEELSLSGASTDTTTPIPNRAIVFAVTTRTTEPISGPASYDCGIAGEVDKYGGSLGIAAGSTNSGVTGPTAFYADTPIRLTANGAPFSGGKVRVAIHALLCSPSTS